MAAHGADGTLWVLWQRGEGLNPKQIVVSRCHAGGCDPGEVVGAVNGRVHHAAVRGDQLWVTTVGLDSASPTTNVDVLLWVWDGGWRAPVNLTQSLGSSSQSDGVAALGPASAHLFFEQEDRVYALPVTDTGAAGAPEQVFAEGCWPKDARVANDGRMAVLLDCRSSGVSELGYRVAFGTPGSWTVTGAHGGSLAIAGSPDQALLVMGTDRYDVGAGCGYLELARHEGTEAVAHHALEDCQGVGKLGLALDPQGRVQVAYTADITLLRFSYAGDDGFAITPGRAVATVGSLYGPAISVSPMTGLPAVAWHDAQSGAVSVAILEP